MIALKKLLSMFVGKTIHQIADEQERRAEIIHERDAIYGDTRKRLTRSLRAHPVGSRSIRRAARRWANRVTAQAQRIA